MGIPYPWELSLGSMRTGGVQTCAHLHSSAATCIWHLQALEPCATCHMLRGALP